MLRRTDHVEPSQGTNWIRSSTWTAAMLKLDREKTCPFLLRVFVREGGHHPDVDFSVTKVPSNDEYQLYAWSALRSPLSRSHPAGKTRPSRNSCCSSGTSRPPSARIRPRATPSSSSSLTQTETATSPATLRPSHRGTSPPPQTPVRPLSPRRRPADQTRQRENVG